MKHEFDMDKFFKWLARFVFIVLIVCFLVILALESQAKAQTVTGSVPLGGFTKDLEEFYESGEFYTEDDLNLLAEVMYHENGSNSDKCILYTGSVVLNRVSDKDFPNTIHDVLYQRGQYSTTKMFYTKPIPKHIYDLAKELLIFGSQLDKSYVFQAMFIQSKEYIKVDSEFFCRK